MALLKFKMGNWTTKFTDTTQTPIEPGTVYITKNEGGMYVDTDENKRIRISGDIIQYDSIGDPRISPPFSTDVLYYFIKENALMKWNGTTWVQLNSVSDLQANITVLQNDVATLKTKVGAAAATDEDGQPVVATGLFADVAALQAKDTDLQKQIVANKEAIESNDSELVDLTSRMTAAETITATVSGIADQVTINKTSIEEISKVVGNSETQDTLVYRVDALENSENGILSRISSVEAVAAENKAAIGDVNTSGTINNRIKALQDGLAATNTTVDGHTQTLSDHTDIINQLKEAVGENAEGLAGKVQALTTELNEAKTDISNIKNKNNDQDTAIKNAADLADANKTAIEQINGSGEGSITYAVAAEAKTRLEEDAKLQESISGLLTRVGAVETKNSEQDNLITAVTNQASSNKTAIDNLNGDEENEESIAYKIKQAKEALSKEIDKDINAANAMEYQGNITAIDNLPTSNVKIGDTYVVASKFSAKNSSDETVYYNAGDMLIATGTENESTGYIEAGLSWNHVKTGYDAANEAHLTGKNDVINLTSHLSDNLGDLGKITFVDGGSGIKATIDDNKVTLSMVWGTF